MANFDSDDIGELNGEEVKEVKKSHGFIKLEPDDVRYVVSHIPKDVRSIISRDRLFLAGGFIRSIIAGERPSDIDLFGPTEAVLRASAEDLQKYRMGSRIHKSDNAYTLLSPPRKPIQFITRWLYLDPEVLLKEFDFTVAQAIIWWDGDYWQSLASPRFYVDLAAKRLYYTSPVRKEDAGGSLLRVRKFLSKGYSIQIGSLAAVVARLAMAVDWDALKDRNGGKLWEERVSTVIHGLLREVDPNTVIDGFEVHEDPSIL